ncbi:unnamed protein product [Closterium sp. NIES-64]|nr:unnamed protein product [Closterium sp. NIES-64]
MSNFPYHNDDDLSGPPIPSYKISSFADPSMEGPPIHVADAERQTVLTSLQGELIRESYAELEPDLDKHAIIMYLTYVRMELSLIFDMVPDAKRLFSMVRESSEPAPVNIKLNAHATMSFRMMCEAFCKWDDPAQVEKSVPFFKALGGRHLNYGIDGNDFPVFRTGFMKALKKAFGERWHGELEGAWCAAFDMLEGVASTGMAEGGGFKRVPAFMLA